MPLCDISPTVANQPVKITKNISVLGLRAVLKDNSEIDRFAPLFEISAHCGQKQDGMADPVAFGCFLKTLSKGRRQPRHETPATLARGQPFTLSSGIEGRQKIADGLG